MLNDPPQKTFNDLMAMKEIPVPNSQKHLEGTCRYFQSTTRPFKPLAAPGVFGGHVVAQCAIAGANTVGKKYIIHNIHGYFILPGKQDVPYTYKVETIRNGRSYSVRQIRVYQPDPELGPIDQFDFGSKYMCFMGICSYKEPENGVLDHQKPLPEELAFKDLKHNIFGFPLAPDVDIPSFEEWTNDPENAYEKVSHPIEFRKVKMDEYNDKQSQVSDRRQIHFLKSHDKLPNNPNLHIAALLYASDRNSLFTILNLQDNKSHVVNRIASIDHAFIMHNLDTRVDDDWLTMETYTDRSHDGRGLYQGRMYDQHNRLVCSFMQDGVVRVFGEDDGSSGGKWKTPKSNL